MLTCKQVTELVTDFAEGRLSFGDRLRFQLHLGMCSSCRAYVRQLKVATRAVGELPEPELSPELKEELRRRFERWKAGR